MDGDVVDKSNLNRQLISLSSTIGKSKAEVMRLRALDINPEAEVKAVNKFYTPDTADEFDISGYSYVVDAVDMVSAKLELISRAKAEGVPIISSMGAGNKIGTEPFETADIYKTSVCPLARVMRAELKKRGIKDLKVVYSKEKPCASCRPPGSISFVPSAAGLCIAGEVVRDLIAE